MAKRNMLDDELKEIQHPRNGAIWGIRNGGRVAYVWDKGEPKGSWETRYSMGCYDTKGDSMGSGHFTNDLEKAKERARGAVSGRAFRHLLRRMGS